MRHLLVHLHRLVFIAILLSASVVHAQWKNIAPNLFGDFYLTTSFVDGGSLVYCDGILWGGKNDLLMSSDLGKTWTLRSPPVSINSDVIYDVSFFDAFHGIIVTAFGYAYITQDGGITWQKANIPLTSRSSPFLNAYTCFYIGSSQTIVVSSGLFGLFVSRDGGATWTETAFGVGQVKGFGRWVHGNTAYMLISDPGDSLTCQLAVTTDAANSWQIMPGTTFVDCYSFAVDACDTNTVYVANDAGLYVNNNASNLFESNDLGAQWNVTLREPLFYIEGSFAASPNAMYMQTTPQGILRTLDKGKNWTPIGGPNISFDSRFLVALDDNTLFAVDSSGSLWETNNSGGDSVKFGAGASGLFSIDRDTLFSSDTLYSCNPAITETLHFKKFGCLPASIIGLEFSGTANYAITDSTGDSIQVSFSPNNGSQATGTLTLNMSDGSTNTISLLGAVKQPKTLSMATSDESTDTIGGLVAVPITVSGLDAPSDIDLVVHYDVQSLTYDSSYSPASGKFDIAGEQWSGRSKLHIPNASNNIVLGYSILNAFVDSLGKANVRFDSLTVTSSSLPCEYDLSNSVLSVITEVSGCGTILVSSLLQYDSLPKFSIRPNPASELVALESTTNLDVAHIEICDALGRQQSVWDMKLSASTAANLDIRSLANGMYFIRISANGATISIPFLIRR